MDEGEKEMHLDSTHDKVWAFCSTGLCFKLFWKTFARVSVLLMNYGSVNARDYKR